MKILLSVLLVLAAFSYAVAQKKDDLTVASERAEKAALVLKQFSSLGADSVPFGIFRKAKGVLAFSNITEVNILLNKLTKGKGVMSLQTESGWSTPIFVNFASLSYQFKLAGKKNFDVIFFIMNDGVIDLLKKDGIKPQKITGEALALGPVVNGKGADVVIEKAAIIYYTFENGQLSGQEFQNDAFFSSVGITIDNNLNKAVYKRKSQLILNRNENDLKVPPAIDNFRQTLSQGLSQNN